MKKITAILAAGCLASLMLPSFANASITRLGSYSELLEALKNGHRVNAVIEAAKCKFVDSTKPTAAKPKVKDPDLSMILGLSFNTNFFLLYQDANDPRTYLATIATNSIGGNESGPHLRYKRVKVYDDNSVEIYAARAEFETGKTVAASRAFCGISNGHDQNGASLFDYDAGSNA